ncbi:TIR domain-containing protein [Paraburkholderia sp. CNPSo 3157]|uniref:TIR domain-containing protein n=1 Tax=Paraburkholderia franconis TaxID=2654983 RepID=A0A7X1N7S4_9BURK|nr:toll/interleukin-1 receptor domain-containing protein [Paraburkholderia franconis]MPW16581.1 TIR domain-containing protein [Paraburkholderia franconis]
MRPIFISYRREDSEGQAGRLFESLREVFGEQMVFMDVATIEPGADFRRAIETNIDQCGVVLSLIGRTWLTVTGKDGKRRLDNPNDFVRLETSSALKRGVTLIPVLVQGATMPQEADLPDDIKDLAYRNSIELTHARWDSDVQLLINALRGHAGAEKDTTPAAPPAPEKPVETKRRTRLLPIVGALAAVGLTGAVLLKMSGSSQHAPAVEDALASPASVAVDRPAASGVISRVELQRRAHLRGACIKGYVWRQARPGDRICVTPDTQARVYAENRAAADNRSPTGGAYGPNTCKNGFVWREAFQGDDVCVTPDAREQTAQDNSLAVQRIVPMPQ